MSVADIEKNCNATMAKCVEYLKDELRGVRTGRASPALVEHLKVMVASYGSTMNLRDLATISAPDPGPCSHADRTFQEIRYSRTNVRLGFGQCLIGGFLKDRLS